MESGHSTWIRTGMYWSGNAVLRYSFTTTQVLTRHRKKLQTISSQCRKLLRAGLQLKKGQRRGGAINRVASSSCFRQAWQIGAAITPGKPKATSSSSVAGNFQGSGTDPGAPDGRVDELFELVNHDQDEQRGKRRAQRGGQADTDNDGGIVSSVRRPKHTGRVALATRSRSSSG
jgi:hypothetical protein